MMTCSRSSARMACTSPSFAMRSRSCSRGSSGMMPPCGTRGLGASGQEVGEDGASFAIKRAMHGGHHLGPLARGDRLTPERTGDGLATAVDVDPEEPELVGAAV